MIYGQYIGIAVVCFFVLFGVMLYLITQREELSKMLQYSENVEINKLRKERSDLKYATREELLNKFNLK